MRVPELRFEGFNGEWEATKLDKLGEVVNGLTYSPDNVKENGVLVLRSSNVQSRKLSFDNNVFVNITAGHFNPVKKNDILICVRNGSKNLIGKNTLITKEIEGLAFGAFMSIYRSDKGEFLFQWFDTDTYKRQVHQNLGATINSINGADLRKFKLAVPDTKEQQKICDFLRSVDVWLDNLRSQKTALETYKRGMMQKLFTQQVRFKDDQGSDFPAWQLKSLNNLAISVKGKGLSKDDINLNGKTKCIRYAELYTEYSEVITGIKSKTNLIPNSMVVSKIGDILFPSSGETSKDIATFSSLSEAGVILSGDLNAIRFHDSFCTPFFAYYLSNYYNGTIARYAQGNSIVHLYWSHFKIVKILVPSIAEQQKIADILTAIDQTITAKAEEVAKVEQWKKGLMQKMFV